MPPFFRMSVPGRALALSFALLVLAACSGGGGSGSGAPHDPSLDQNLPPVDIPDLPPGTASERFFVIGDQGTGQAGQYAVAQAMGLKALADGIDFVITTGDNIYEEGVSSANDPDWLKKFEDVYAAPVLAVPFYASLGNHDHLGSVQAEIDYTANSDQWVMLSPFYTFTRTLGDGTDVQFFAIDSNPLAKGSITTDAQLAWLDGQLDASTARWKLVYGHHPIHSSGNHGDTAKLVAKLLPVLLADGVDVYFSGHDHSLQMMAPTGGLTLIVSGAAGGPDNATSVKWTGETLYASTGGGFVSARVSHDQLLVEFVRMDGLVQFATTLDK